MGTWWEDHGESQPHLNIEPRYPDGTNGTQMLETRPNATVTI